MTTVGENRRRYSREVEPNPRRFFEPAEYRAWAARADAWATTHPREETAA